jgi:hypothetical protein
MFLGLEKMLSTLKFELVFSHPHTSAVAHLPGFPLFPEKLFSYLRMSPFPQMDVPLSH